MTMLRGIDRLPLARFAMAERERETTYAEIAALAGERLFGGAWEPTRNQIAAAIRDHEELEARYGNGNAPARHEGHDEGTRGRDAAEVLSHKSVTSTMALHIQEDVSDDEPPRWDDLQGALGDDDVTIERILEVAEMFKGLTNAADPVYTGGTLRVRTDTPIGVMFVSCAHLGGRYTDHVAFWNLITRALELPNMYFAMLGDDIEGFLPGHIDRESEMKQPLNLDIQMILLQKITRYLAKAKRLLFGMAGQHSGDWMNRRYGDNPVKRAFTEQGVPYFDGQAYFPLSVGSQRYMIAVAHQFPGSSQTNPLHAQGRALRWNFPMADVIAQGDKHTYAMSEQTAYPWEYKVGNRASPYVWLIQTGTAKTGPDKYTIKRWSEGTFMWPVLVFGAQRHQVEGIKHLSMAEARLAREAQRG